MRFEFERVPIQIDGRSNGIALQPRVEMIFTNPKNGESVPVKALVDSGAGACILNARFAELLGIDLESGTQSPILGITSEAIAYAHPIKIKLNRDFPENEFLITCVFLPNLNTDGLLGLAGFFENYRVVIEYYRNVFEVKARRK